MSANDLFVLASFLFLLSSLLWLVMYLLLQHQQLSENKSVKVKKRTSAKRVKIEKRRLRARERQQTGKHHSTNTNAFYEAVTAVFNKRNENIHPNFETIYHQTMAHFERCQRPTTKPTLVTDDALYWNVDDEFVVRYSRLWSNNGRILYSKTPCCWVLEPSYYDEHQAVAEEKWMTGKCRYDEMEFYAIFSVHFGNFFKNTTATYNKCGRPDRPPAVTSPSGSEYWETPQGVIRCSDHWSNTCGRIATCWWTYEPDKETKRHAYANGERQRLVGFCPYERFSVKSERKTLWRYAKQFLSRNAKDRKRLRFRQARTGVVLDQYSRRLVNYRLLPKIMFQPKHQRARQEEEDHLPQAGFWNGMLRKVIHWILLVTPSCWISTPRELGARGDLPIKTDLRA